MRPYSYHVPILRVVRDGSVKMDERPNVCSPPEVAKVFSTYLEGADREHLVVMLLNMKNRILGINTVSVGQVGHAVVSIADIFKPAITHNASRVILCHNHPSGDPTPSYEDIRITGEVIKAGKLLDIPVLDHIVVGDHGEFVSMREREICQF